MTRAFAAVLICFAVICCASFLGGQKLARNPGAARRAVETLTPAMIVEPEPREELIVELPEDGGVWHTTLVYGESREADPASRRLSAWFATDPRLRSLTAQTTTHQFNNRSPLFRARYAQQMGGVTPQIWIQRSDGYVVYKASGANIPATSHALADEIVSAIGQCKPCQPRPSPTPDVTPDVEPTDTPPAIDDVRPTPDPVADSFADLGKLPWWLLLVPVLAAIAALIFVRR